jgi:hypothetical protein
MAELQYPKKLKENAKRYKIIENIWELKSEKAELFSAKQAELNWDK